ncbi:ribosomal oxygenase 2-like [Diadema antillarum]|uniref:ribosomal oxygenase 2-like n=1 Tax=Diadema antillarum TaxID=105358 RepID=UPI003A83CEE7
MPKRRASHKPQNGVARGGKLAKQQDQHRSKGESCAENSGEGDLAADAFGLTTPAQTFAQLIHPTKPETFFQDIWERQPMVIRCSEARGNLFGSLFSRSILEELVAKHKVLFGQDCNVCRYRGEKRESLNGKGPVKLGQLRSLLDKSKATVQFHHPQRFQDSIWQLLERLESYFGCLVGSNIYMTPRGSQGLAPHYDDVEVFVLQLEGEKRWRLYKPPVILPRDYSKDLDQAEIGDPILDTVLKAGDVLYFPRGTVHQAETPDTCDHSTHLTVSTYQRAAWGDLLSLALPAILQSAIEGTQSLREGLPLQFCANNQQMSNSETGQKLKNLISGLSNHIASHAQDAANEMLCDFIANRLPPYSDGELDCSPQGPMPSNDHSVRLRFPDHTFLVRCKMEDEEEEDEEEEDEEEEEEKEEYHLFVYHSLQSSRQDHMMSSESKEVQGIQLPRACETAARTLLTRGKSWQRVTDIDLEDGIRGQMLTSLWAEGLLEVQDL